MPVPSGKVDTLLSVMDPPVSTWNTTAAPAITMTYRFAGNAQPSDFNFGSFSGWTAFTEPYKAAVRSVLDEYASVINVAFTEAPTASDPDINFGRVSFSPGQAGQGGFTYQYSTSGNPPVVTSKSMDSYAVWRSNLDLTTQDNRNILLHEFGHALTLRHPGNYDAGGQPPPPPYLPAAEDNNKYTVMAYAVNPDNGLLSDHLMLYDIAALQARFGANMTWHTGADVYAGPAGGRIQTIWDAGGTDTLDGSANAAGNTIDLNEGAFSSIGTLHNLAIAYNVLIENAIGGSGGDTIIGNNATNNLTGGPGTDIFQSTMLGLSTDTITDLSQGEKIVVTDGAANFTFSRTGTTLSYGNGAIQFALTLSNNPAGQFVQSAHQGGGVELTLQNSSTGSISINDVQITEGDSSSKVMTFTVTRSGGTAAFNVNFATSDGSATVADGDYVANSGTLQFGANVNSQPISIAINGDTKFELNETLFVNLSAATNGAAVTDSQGQATIINDDSADRDFNGDGSSDILLRRADGHFLVADFVNNQFSAFAFPGGMGPEWATAGVGDFNEDGTSDLLLRRGDGHFLVADFVNNQFSAFAFPGGMGPEWATAGVGDFNGDASSDVLLRRADGHFLVANFIDNQFSAFAFPGGMGPEWATAGVGDFNSDGSSDVLLRRADGHFLVADFVNNQFSAFAFPGGMGPEWATAGVGDFNGDASSDVLLRRADGHFLVANFVDNQFSAFAFPGGMGPEWATADVGDFNGDGSSDVLLRRADGHFLVADFVNNQFSAFAFPGGMGPEWLVV